MSRCVAFARIRARRCSGEIQRPAQRFEFLTRRKKFHSAQFQDNKTMKTKSIATIAALALLPIAAFAQPNPPNPPPPPGNPPNGPVVNPDNARDRDRHEKKVPVTFLGAETSNARPLDTNKGQVSKYLG